MLKSSNLLVSSLYWWCQCWSATSLCCLFICVFVYLFVCFLYFLCWFPLSGAVGFLSLFPLSAGADVGFLSLLVCQCWSATPPLLVSFVCFPLFPLLVCLFPLLVSFISFVGFLSLVPPVLVSHPPFHQTQILDFRTNLLRVPNITIIVILFNSI